MKVISLFSGAGGLDLGFVQAGHQIIWANDIDKDAVETYKKNLGNHIVLKDLKEVDTNDIPDADIVIGGFPCQGFSVANRNRGTGDERNTLYLEMLRVIRDKKPTFFVAENVKGILSLDKGSVIKMICKDFENAGYKVKYKLFNLADYGVPQKRERVIFIGVRNDMNFEYEFPMPTHEENPTFDLFNQNALQRWVSISEVLAGLPEPSEDSKILNHVCSNYKIIENKNFTGHRMINPDKPSPTILARGNGKGGVVVIHHPSNTRRMSVRETAIIQGFPMDFEFIGSKTSCYRQIGNAVPPIFGKQIAIQFNQFG
ncbi:DNA (cytosine-5-)-methyltransferase [Bacillus thuringiensis]|uniref:Cytosine-specific methyltransferase n=1 Tax=Bacillus cereus (strain G9842) TaxID=405531 RepID=B7IS02_BACC2|nr:MULTISPECIES: DNA cytosine methyltransferase [Bacillus cereus group]ACK95857.1 modification methylase HaeIII [Bacillus cereus G9842]MDR4137264.1 DNA cytosine methyltransferase [Bacillus cereus]MDR4365811.1 DNA cytosine methyltransferase [Bacillus cereus]PER84780.1 DNA (cytosine-5-)-methyltransferase [Bacillus thuringiensis]PGS46097.1 DNA (cytosine-5-)-methyltransferase [Bacillus thuringiensis]